MSFPLLPLPSILKVGHPAFAFITYFSYHDVQQAQPVWGQRLPLSHTIFTRQTPLSRSICGHRVAENVALLTEDAIAA